MTGSDGRDDEHGLRFAILAPNIIVKFSTTTVGIGSLRRRPTGV